jgi:cytochrome c5
MGSLALLACSTSEAELAKRQAPEEWSEAWLMEEGQRYLHDASFRRKALEDSLTNADNIYSRTRLSGYGIAGRGWEMLPSWTPVTRAVDDAYVDALAEGAPLTLGSEATLLWDGEEPGSMAEWVELGRRVFYEYPLRSEVFAEHALRSKEVAAKVGLGSDEKGIWPGVVAYETVDGEAAIGITCALCHVSMEGGKMVEGRARRNFDYGEMRLAFYRDTGAFLDEEVKRRMAAWGPGRADITQDDDEDPVAIVDLWGVRNHAYLTQSGTLRHKHPAALAIRQETQLLHANHERIRPPRELAWALAMFVYSLTPPPREPVPESEELARGAALFAKACDHCHRDESYGGLPVSAEKIGTDPMLAKGEARGTGLYRPAPLIRVAQAAPYLHDGSVATLAELFDPERKVPGHRYGDSWPLADRNALIAFLETL